MLFSWMNLFYYKDINYVSTYFLTLGTDKNVV